MRAYSLAAGAAALVLMASSALACQGPKVLFEDTFDRLDPTWGVEDDAFFIKNGELNILPNPDQAYYAFNNSGYYDDVDYCVDVIAINADLAGDSYAGEIFWGIDKDNYYSFLVTADGFASVFRRQKGKTLSQVDWEKFDAVKTGADAVNQLRVVTQGNKATLYVNGAEFRTITGQPPDDGWQFGVRAASPKNSKATYGFDNVKITVGGAADSDGGNTTGGGGDSDDTGGGDDSGAGDGGDSGGGAGDSGGSTVGGSSGG